MKQHTGKVDANPATINTVTDGRSYPFRTKLLLSTRSSFPQREASTGSVSCIQPFHDRRKDQYVGLIERP